MALEKISDKQKEILEFIKSEILNRGYPPSVRDICEGVHLKSTSSVHAHLETLERKGYIRRDPAKNRAIEIIDDSFGLQRREMVNVPLVGRIDDSATVKTFYKENGHIRLQPENDTMDPIIVPDCEILGKVFGVFRFF